MKKTPLLVLSFAFFILGIVCFFYPECSNKMHIALLVQSFFFMRFVMVKKNRAFPEIAEIPANNGLFEKEEKRDKVDTTLAEVRNPVRHQNK